MNKFFQWLSILTIFLSLFLIFLLGFWMFFPYKTVKFMDKDFPVQNKIVKQGENLRYKVCYCKYTKLRPVITRTFIDDIIYAMPSTVGVVNPLGCGTNNIELLVPNTLPPGKYVLQTIYRYQVNPIRTIDITTNTEQFTVIK